MRRYSGFIGGFLPVFLGLLILVPGCTSKDLKNETVATVDGDTITVGELREFLGARGRDAAASMVPIERKKEALERLIGGRLLADHARSLGLENTEEFRKGVRRNGQGVLITALYRKRIAGMKLPGGDVKAEANRIRVADNTLSEEEATRRAEQVAMQKELKKLEENLIVEAKKEFPASIDNVLIQKIGNGENVDDNVVLATVGVEQVTYGEVKGLLSGMTGGTHGRQDLSRNPVAVSRMLDREATGQALAAYARKQGIEGSEWMRQVQEDMERSILIDLVAEQEILKNVEVTEKEVKASYDEHAQMFVRDGEKVPLAQVKGQIRQFLENEKRKHALEDYVEELRNKAKITIHEAILPRV